MTIAIDFTQAVTAEAKAVQAETERRAAIKSEANARILTVCPQWKQLNLTAQNSALIKKGVANWTQEEADAWAASEAVWAQIAEIRNASDALEAMNPLPANYRDDVYWP